MPKSILSPTRGRDETVERVRADAGDEVLLTEEVEVEPLLGVVVVLVVEELLPGVDVITVRPPTVDIEIQLPGAAVTTVVPSTLDTDVPLPTTLTPLITTEPPVPTTEETVLVLLPPDTTTVPSTEVYTPGPVITVVPLEVVLFVVAGADEVAVLAGVALAVAGRAGLVLANTEEEAVLVGREETVGRTAIAGRGGISPKAVLGLAGVGVVGAVLRGVIDAAEGLGVGADEGSTGGTTGLTTGAGATFGAALLCVPQTSQFSSLAGLLLPHSTHTQTPPDGAAEGIL